MNVTPPVVSDFLDLSDRSPVARGSVRDVFERPGHPDQILKTIRLEKRQSYVGRGGPVFAFLHHATLGPYRSFLREYRSYLKTAYLAERMGRPIPIAEFGPVIRTDQGLAQVSQRVSDETGALAPTLRQLIGERRLDGDLIARLNTFVDDIYLLRVNAPDLSLDNIVFFAAEKRFLLIDGYGDKTVIPLRRWIHALNRKQIDSRFEKIGRKRGLSWDMGARRFALDPTDQ